MKYFTKYLPVEGEIKPDDLYFQTYKEGQVGKANKDDYSNGAYKDKQKVKLFLCSRDIAVGDKIRYEAIPDKEWIVNEHGKERDGFQNLNHAKGCFGFKVIGEVSPEVRFVKEGDEFSDDEVAFIYEPGEDMDREYISIDEKKRHRSKKYLNTIAIKCKCCGNFAG